ncbi:MAG: NTP transferase domain-containing protein, partial [Candidatus Marinimicrobia bacterium]|nr:NTP transferase domain-containing protein [Candidatus Neomarinimicrobiota bacterium]
MKAVILAAGVSRRLYPMTYEMPKCLIEVGEKPILDHQLIALQSADVNDIVLVVGYYREAIINHVQTNFPDMNIEYVINHHYF